MADAAESNVFVAVRIRPRIQNAQNVAQSTERHMPTAAALSPQARPAAPQALPPPIAQAPQAHLGFQGGYGSGRGAPPLPHVIASSNGPNNGPNGARGGPPPAPQ